MTDLAIQNTPSPFRLSASQVNTFLNEPSVWILDKFYGVRGEAGASAKRGNAVELVVSKVLGNGLAFDMAVDQALYLYDSVVSDTDEKYQKERDNIAPMSEQALELFLNLDGLKDTQVKLDKPLDDVPFLGYADYDFNDCYVDLKTTLRCPSCAENISSEHIRQVAYYYHASGKPQKLAYVTPKKYAIYEVTQDQINKGLAELKAAAKAMWACYDIQEKQGRDVLATLYPPRDTNSFYWSNETLNKAQDVWF